MEATVLPQSRRCLLAPLMRRRQQRLHRLWQRRRRSRSLRRRRRRQVQRRCRLQRTSPPPTLSWQRCFRGWRWPPMRPPQRSSATRPTRTTRCASSAWTSRGTRRWRAAAARTRPCCAPRAPSASQRAARGRCARGAMRPWLLLREARNADAGLASSGAVSAGETCPSGPHAQRSVRCGARNWLLDGGKVHAALAWFVMHICPLARHAARRARARLLACLLPPLRTRALAANASSTASLRAGGAVAPPLPFPRGSSGPSRGTLQRSTVATLLRNCMRT